MHEADPLPGWITGQLAALGIAVNVLLAEDGQRDALVASIAAQLDQVALAAVLPGFRRGLNSGRRVFVPPPMPH